ncbi:MAG: hypothetical protein GY792_19730, partial [Gammaproteobacteria bacterium]|nr:hypothetical protein [Gammaproteobacteria bacterium]
LTANDDATVEGTETIDIQLNGATITNGTATVNGGASQNVSTDITEIDNAPVSTDNSYTLDEGALASSNIITDDTGVGADSDSDLPAQTLTIESVNGTAWASLTDSTDGTYTSGLGYKEVSTTNGTIYIKSDGVTQYQHDDSETTSDSFTYTISDGSNGSNTSTVSYVINPVNEAPVLTGDLSANIYEGATYTITGADLGYTDPDDVDAGITFTTSAASNGKIQVNGSDATSFTGTELTSGLVTFVHDGSEALAASFDVNVEDGNEDSSAPVESTFNFTVTPVNDTPVIGGTDSSSITEDVDPDSDGLLEVGSALTIADPDAGESSFQAETINGTYGDLTIDTAGNWTYAADKTQLAIQQLDSGESVSEVLTVTTFDGATHDIAITINGAEDAPVITATSTGTVAEDGIMTATGTLAISDADSNDNPVGFNDLASTPGDNGYGSFELINGTWSYTLDNNHADVQTLNANDSLIDSYTFIATNGSTQMVTIEIHGTTDSDESQTEKENPESPETPADSGSSTDSDSDTEAQEAVLTPDDSEEPSEEPAAENDEEVDLAAMVGDLQPIDISTIGGSLAELETGWNLNETRLEAKGVAPPKWIDLKQLDIASFEAPEFEALKVPTLMENKQYIQSLDDVARDMSEAAEREHKRVGLGQEAVMGVTLSLSAGFVSWVLRAGSLMASFMSVVPMWKQLDPLPILGAASIKAKKDLEKKNEGEAKEVETIFSAKNESH